MTEIWTKAERANLEAILDQLIPANRDRDIPAAGELGVADFLAREVAGNAELGDAISALLAKAAMLEDGISPYAVRTLETDLPGEFRMLLVATYKGYYSRADMRALVGVGTHPVHPQGYEVPQEPPELMHELTAPVRARGPFYRDPSQ